MHVVAARVHQRHRLAVGIDAGHRARVLEPDLLADWERIRIGAQQHGRSGAVVEDTHDSGAPDPGRDRQRRRDSDSWWVASSIRSGLSLG